jgi:hypothetical protein
MEQVKKHGNGKSLAQFHRTIGLVVNDQGQEARRTTAPTSEQRGPSVAAEAPRVAHGDAGALRPDVGPVDRDDAGPIVKSLEFIVDRYGDAIGHRVFVLPEERTFAANLVKLWNRRPNKPGTPFRVCRCTYEWPPRKESQSGAPTQGLRRSDAQAGPGDRPPHAPQAR